MANGDTVHIKGEDVEFFINGQKLGRAKSIEIQFEGKRNKHKIVNSPEHFETTITNAETGLRVMSPILRKHFKVVRMAGKLYI
jgi:hypothetical protein